MLSKKMTVSLMSLITILALAFVAGDAFAAEKPFEIKITGPTTAAADLTGAGAEVMVDLMVESAQPIPELSILNSYNTKSRGNYFRYRWFCHYNSD